MSAYNRADSFLSEHQSIAEYAKNKGKTQNATNKKGGQSGNVKSKKKKERSANGRPYAKDIAYCQAVQSMCGGYYKVRLSFFNCLGSAVFTFMLIKLHVLLSSVLVVMFHTKSLNKVECTVM